TTLFRSSVRQRGAKVLMYWMTSSSSGAGICQASMAVPWRPPVMMRRKSSSVGSWPARRHRRGDGSAAAGVGEEPRGRGHHQRPRTVGHTQCSDGIDNDGDGRIDYFDQE